MCCLHVYVSPSVSRSLVPSLSVAPLPVPMFSPLCFILCLPGLLCVSMFVYPHIRVKLPCPCLSLGVRATSCFILLGLAHVHCDQFCVPCLIMFICSCYVPMCFHFPNLLLLYILSPSPLIPHWSLCLSICVCQVSCFSISKFRFFVAF